MKRYVLLFVSYIACINVGAYIASEVKFGVPIEEYRWALGIFTMVAFIIAAEVELRLQKKKDALDVVADEYYDAECHVIRGMEDGESRWKYFYEDQDGFYKESKFFYTKKDAIEHYIKQPRKR